MARPVITLRELRAPPSANNLFADKGGGHGGRAKSTAYKKWIQEAGWTIVQQLAGQRGEPLEGPVSVMISAHLSRRRDLDNIVKPLLDLLVELRIIKDDQWVDFLSVTRHPAFKEWPEERVTLRVEKLLGSGDVGDQRERVLGERSGPAAADDVAVEGDPVDDAPAARRIV